LKQTIEVTKIFSPLLT